MPEFRCFYHILISELNILSLFRSDCITEKCSLKDLHATFRFQVIVALTLKKCKYLIQPLVKIPWNLFITSTDPLVLLSHQHDHSALQWIGKFQWKMFGNVASYNLYLSRVGDLRSELSSPSALCLHDHDRTVLLGSHQRKMIIYNKSCGSKINQN